jgi:hypothetical protein
MGQYYIPLVGNAFGTNRKAFDRSFDGRYEVSKLMENSWYLNPFVNAISALFYSEASRLVWIGDYATEADDFYFKGSSALCVPSYEEAWGEGVALIKTSASDFTLDGKFLLNYDTRQFVDLDEYMTEEVATFTKATSATKVSARGHGIFCPSSTIAQRNFANLNSRSRKLSKEAFT